MNIKQPRVNVTFNEETIDLLEHFAKKKHQSVSSLVRELVNEALEIREDFYLSKLAEKIDKADAKVYTHQEVWK